MLALLAPSFAKSLVSRVRGSVTHRSLPLSNTVR